MSFSEPDEDGVSMRQIDPLAPSRAVVVLTAIAFNILLGAVLWATLPMTF